MSFVTRLLGRRARATKGRAPEGPARRGAPITPEVLESRRLLSVAALEVGSSTWAEPFTQALAGHGLGTVGYRVSGEGAGATSVNLPWVNLDRVTAKFTAPVDSHAGELFVAGARVASYPVTAMDYDAATFTASWTLGRALTNDKVLVRLRTPDGVLSFRFNVLPGDASQSGGAVNAVDLGAVRADRTPPASPTASFPAPALFRDVDGSGAVDALDVGAVRGRLSTRLPAREPQVAMATIPNSDTWLGTVINGNNHIASPFHLRRLSTKLPMMTDMIGTNSRTWLRALATLRAQRPNLLVGTYHSARDSQLSTTFNSYPRRAVPREGLSDGQILMRHPTDPNIEIIDYSQPAARKYLVDHVVSDVLRTGRPLVLVDNISHAETGFPMPWETTMQLAGELASNLHAMGKRVVFNAAWVPGWTSMQSVDQFIASGADGVTLEMGFIWSVRNSVDRIRTAITQYRKMLDAGMMVGLMPIPETAPGVDPNHSLEVEQRVHAAFAMMFRKPGDRLFVTQSFWRVAPDWASWPERFGAALGDATISTNGQGQIVLTRQFAHYTLTLNATTKVVSAVPRGGA